MKSKITVANIDVNITKKDIKNIHLSVMPPFGEVRISTPLKTSDESIKVFIRSKVYWINKQIKQFENQLRQTQREYLTGESHYVFGERYLLNVIHHNKKPLIRIRNRTYIDYYINHNLNIKSRTYHFEKWNRETLKEEILKILIIWEEKVGIKAKEVKIRKMKTKWGSSNKEKQFIVLNSELVKKPKKYLEYVIVHELVHFLERTHNSNFVYHMDRLLPNWRTLKKELNEFIL